MTAEQTGFYRDMAVRWTAYTSALAGVGYLVLAALWLTGLDGNWFYVEALSVTRAVTIASCFSFLVWLVCSLLHADAITTATFGLLALHEKASDKRHLQVDRDVMDIEAMICQIDTKVAILAEANEANNWDEEGYDEEDDFLDGLDDEE